MATEEQKLEELIEKLKQLKSLGISVNVDSEQITNADAAMKELQKAQIEINRSTTITNLEYERADRLIKNSISSLEQMKDVDQKILINLIEQNKEREEAEKKEKSRLQTLQKVLKVVIEQNRQFDIAASSLNKVTATTGEFNDALLDVSIQSRIVGATSADVSKNLGVLFNSFSNFSRISKEQQTNLTNFATTLDKVGINIDTFSMLLDVGTKSIGMSIPEVQQFTKELVSFGQKAGISIQRLNKDLTSVGSKLLAVFGKNSGQRIFKEMSLASKNLGTSMESLFDIVEGYTTFSGAADAAARLNTLLGGNVINSLDLMNASLNNPTDALRMLKQAVDDSNMTFEEMSPAFRRALAEAAGISDISQLAKILTQDVDEASEAVNAQAKTQEELNKIAQKFVPIGEKFKTLIASLAPIFNNLAIAISEVLDFLIGLTNFKGSEIAKTITFFVTIAVLKFTVLGKAFSWLVGKFSNLTGKLLKPFEKIGEAAKQMGKKFGSAGKFAEKGAKGLLAIGASALMMGAGIAIAAFGLAQLAASFKDLGNAAWPAAAAIVGFTIAFGVLMFKLMALVVAGPQAVLAAGAVTLLLAVGAAALMIGGGVYLATQGISNLVNSMKSLLALDDVVDNLESFVKFMSPDNILQMESFSNSLASIANQFERIANAMREISTLQVMYQNITDVMKEINTPQTMYLNFAQNTSDLDKFEKLILNNVKNSEIDKKLQIKNASVLNEEPELVVKTEQPKKSLKMEDINLQFQQQTVDRYVANDSKNKQDKEKESKVVQPIVNINGEVKLDDMIVGKFVKKVAKVEIQNREKILTGMMLGT